MDRRQKTNALQWTVFLDFAEQHPVIFTKKFDSLNSKTRYIQLWNEISATLNSMGYLQKTVEKWQKTVADWKSKVRAKAADINKGLTQTGGGGPTPPLNENEKRLLAILGWSSVTGMGTAELGFETEACTSNTSQYLEANESIYEVSTPVSSRTSKNLQGNVQSLEAVCSTSDHSYANVLLPPPLTYFESEVKNKSTDSQDKKQSTGTKTPETTVTATIATPKRKLKKTCIKEVNRKSNSSHLNEMHNETLEVLKTISQSLEKMAETQEKLCAILETLALKQ